MFDCCVPFLSESYQCCLWAFGSIPMPEQSISFCGKLDYDSDISVPFSTVCHHFWTTVDCYVSPSFYQSPPSTFNFSTTKDCLIFYQNVDHLKPPLNECYLSSPSSSHPCSYNNKNWNELISFLTYLGRDIVQSLLLFETITKSYNMKIFCM